MTLGRLSDGAAVAGVLTASEVPPGLLDDTIKGGATVASSGGLKLAGGSGTAAGGGGPSLDGTVTLVGSLGPNGEVVSVAAGPTTSLKAIVPCLKAVMASGGFAPPDGGSAEVSVIATFRALAP
jgi:hypothetical protein